MKKFFLTILSIFLFSQLSFAQTALGGKVIETETGNPIIYGLVKLYQNDTLITSVETDFNGRYLFTDLAEGIYNLEISYLGFYKEKILGLELKKNFNLVVNIEMDSPICDWKGIYYYAIPLIETDNLTSGQTISSYQIRQRRSSN